MLCPSCNSDRGYVRKTVRALGGETQRACRCECGASWWTVERVVKGTLRVSGGSPVVSAGSLAVTNDPLMTTGDALMTEALKRRASKIKHLADVSGDSHAEKGEGGFPASGSGSLLPVSSPDPSQPSDPDSGKKDRSSKREARANYSPEFEALWTHTGKCHGNKGAAWKAFQEMALPLPMLDALRFAWDAYMASKGPADGFVYHLATWLNQRGWETDWQPARSIGSKTRDARNTDAIGDWLAKEGANG